MNLSSIHRKADNEKTLLNDIINLVLDGPKTDQNSINSVVLIHFLQSELTYNYSWTRGRVFPSFPHFIGSMNDRLHEVFHILGG